VTVGTSVFARRPSPSTHVRRCAVPSSTRRWPETRAVYRRPRRVTGEKSCVGRLVGAVGGRSPCGGGVCIDGAGAYRRPAQPGGGNRTARDRKRSRPSCSIRVGDPDRGSTPQTRPRQFGSRDGWPGAGLGIFLGSPPFGRLDQRSGGLREKGPGRSSSAPKVPGPAPAITQGDPETARLRPRLVRKVTITVPTLAGPARVDVSGGTLAASSERSTSRGCKAKESRETAPPQTKVGRSNITTSTLAVAEGPTVAGPDRSTTRVARCRTWLARSSGGREGGPSDPAIAAAAPPRLLNSVDYGPRPPLSFLGLALSGRQCYLPQPCNAGLLVL